MIVLTVFLTMLAAAPATAVDQENTAAMEEFAARLRTHVALRTKLEADLPPPEKADDPAAIRARERTLGERLAAARDRRDAGFFTGRLPVLFRRLIADAVHDDGPKATKSVKDDNPGAVALAPYEPYPAGVPLSNVPPAVLKALPDLPADLEYRFVGRDLILRDVRANLVLDVLRDACP